MKYFILNDGRRLAYDEFGDINGIPILYFYGTDDKFAPFKFAIYKKKLIKEAILHYYENSGHLGMIFTLNEIYKIILSRNNKKSRLV